MAVDALDTGARRAEGLEQRARRSGRPPCGSAPRGASGPRSVPARTTRPLRRMATRLQVCSISESRCEFRRIARPRSASARRRSRISRRPTGSTPSVGSSRSRTSGSCTSAAARPSLCTMPLENFFTRTSAQSESRTRSSSVGIRALQRARGHPRHPPEDRERRPRGQIAGKPVPLGQVADAAAAFGPPDRNAENRRLPAGRVRQPEQDLDRGGLARPVGPEQAKDLSGLDLQVERLPARARPCGRNGTGIPWTVPRRKWRGPSSPSIYGDPGGDVPAVREGYLSPSTTKRSDSSRAKQ